MAHAYVPSGDMIRGSAEFFSRLVDAKLPETLRSPVYGSLTVLLENDGETVTPDLASFDAFLRFLRAHQDLPGPAVGVNANGKFVAAWQDQTLRYTLEFLSAGYVRWVRVEGRGSRKQVDGGLVFADALMLPERLPQNTPA